MIIDYDELASKFEYSLLHTLRGHSAALEFLEAWVPDDDPVRGMLNMVEAAQLAGEDAIEVRISLRTLPATRHPELRETLSPLGDVSLRSDGDAVIVRVAGASEPDFESARPDLRAGLHRAFAAMTREGGALDIGDGLVEVCAQEGGVTLRLAADRAPPFIIRAARHDGGHDPVERAALEAVCAAAEEAPLLDAADHATIRAMHALRDRAARRPVQGVIHPGNALPSLGLGERLVRDARAAFMEQNRDAVAAYNDHEAAPSRDWLDTPPTARLDRVGDAIAAYLGNAGRERGTIILAGIEDDLHGYPVRVMISFDDAVSPSEKPGLMRRLEGALKDHLEASLQLYHEPQKDQNVIRRL